MCSLRFQKAQTSYFSLWKPMEPLYNLQSTPGQHMDAHEIYVKNVIFINCPMVEFFGMSSYGQYFLRVEKYGLWAFKRRVGRISTVPGYFSRPLSRFSFEKSQKTCESMSNTPPWLVNCAIYIFRSRERSSYIPGFFRAADISATKSLKHMVDGAFES